jgi:hypothetical protein
MPGLILLSHPVHEDIPTEAMRASLADPSASTIFVKIQPARITLAETLHADWSALQRKQAELVDARLKPLLEEHPDYAVAYFGLAPIPLAIHLGQLVDRWRASEVYQRDHEARGWSWQATGSSPLLAAPVTGLPNDIVRSEDDVVVRVSVTARVDPKETAKVAPMASTEIDIALATCGEDVLRTRDDLDAVGRAFKDVLDRLETHRPNARRLHLFAAVPAGLAFRLGTLISPTRHHRVQTYQFHLTADPKHQRAILLGDSGRRVRELTKGDHDAASATRTQWNNELSRVRDFSVQIATMARDSPAASWVELVAPEAHGAFERPWRDLARFHETLMRTAPIGVGVSSVPDGFKYDAGRAAWLLGDDLVVAINRRLNDPDAVLRAGRMLLFHEALHIQSHRLTDATAPAIRRFPKILEEVDYQADVWAMVHEFAYTRHHKLAAPAGDRDLFLELLRTATETMWAFDEGLDDLEEMELRRVNRYLIWYWQWLRLERSSSLADILNVLAVKPLIELAGPRVYSDGERVFYELREPWRSELELAALLEHNGIARHGRGAATSVPALVEGLRKRSGEKIKLVLKSVLDQDVARR